MMRRILFLLSLAAVSHLAVPVMARQVERSVTGTAGNTLSAGGLQVDFTLGESSTAEMAATGMVVTQGFQQPAAREPAAVGQPAMIRMDYSLYPNPADDRVRFSLSVAGSAVLNMTVLNASGQVMPGSPGLVHIRDHYSHIIDLRSYAPGLYLLHLSDAGGGSVHTMRFVKN